jgi:hypothetical protein
MTDTEPDLATTDLPVEVLRLDPMNPRLRAPVPDATQIELALEIDQRYDPIRIARSIADHGYFPSEPLIVVPGPEDGTFTVLEGNRRLVALQGLLDSELRAQFTEPELWHEVAVAAEAPTHVPVIVAQTKDQVAPIIGYRHISGIEPWDPLQKSRFIVDLIDRSDMSFEDAADLVGEDPGQVREHYRNYSAIQQATQAGIDSTGAAGSFGVFTRAMQNPRIRAYVGAPAPREVETNTWPVDTDRMHAFAELLSWMFGDDEGGGRVVDDSRDLKMLGEVLASDNGVETLRTTNNLKAAFEAAGGPLNLLLNRLTQARNALRAASQGIAAHPDDPEVIALVRECREALKELEAPL